MNTSPEVCFAGILETESHEALTRRLADCLERQWTGLVFAREPSNGTTLCVVLSEGLVGHWQAAGPLDQQQARDWAQRMRESFEAAAAAPPELH